MRLRSLAHLTVALAMVGAPVAASAAPTLSPAASLSVSPSIRAGASSRHNSDMFGSGIFAVAIAIGVIAIIVIVAANDDNPKSP